MQAAASRAASITVFQNRDQFSCSEGEVVDSYTIGAGIRRSAG